MSGQRHRRWANVGQTMGRCVVFVRNDNVLWHYIQKANLGHSKTRGSLYLYTTLNKLSNKMNKIKNDFKHHKKDVPGYMNRALGHLCAHFIGWIGPREPPEDGEMIEMALSSRQRIRNSSPGGMRPSTLPLGHGSSPQYWLSHVDGEETFFVSFKPPSPGTEPRTLAWKAAVLTTTLGPQFKRRGGRWRGYDVWIISAIGEMIEMTLSSRHRIRNSSPGGLRPSTLPLGHGGSP